MGNRSDNFNRSAALNPPSDGGSNWTADAGTWTTQTSVRLVKSASGATWEAVSLEASSAVVDVQATIAVRAIGGVVARVADNNNLILGHYDNAGTPKLWKRVAGTFTQLGSTGSNTDANNDVVKLTCSAGNVLTLYINGVQKVQATDSAGSGNTRHGIMCYDTNPEWDDFSITDQAGSGAVVRPTILTGRAAVQRASRW